MCLAANQLLRTLPVGGHYDSPMTPVDALLDVSSAWPELRAEPGDVVLAEGGSSERLLVLVEGALEVRRDGEVVAIIDQPGACIGEMALLLGTAHTADVVATAPSTLHVLEEARAALTTDAALLGPVAAILASRLRLVTAYLSDLKSQYSDAGPGLGMVSEVLSTLSQHQGFHMEPGSERESEAPY
jgi:CRP/FNR family transcriptional regulator, cyclic AMP receptor protein